MNIFDVGQLKETQIQKNENAKQKIYTLYYRENKEGIWRYFSFEMRLISSRLSSLTLCAATKEKNRKEKKIIKKTAKFRPKIHNLTFFKAFILAL